MVFVKFLAFAGLLAFAYNHSNLFSKPTIAWTNGDIVTLVSLSMVAILAMAAMVLRR
jgi:hypothetical protein